MATVFAGPVKLLGSDLARIDYVYCDQVHRPGVCEVTVTARSGVTRWWRHHADSGAGRGSHRAAVALKPGMNRVSATVPVEQPKLWWPNGAGEQHLYDLTVKVGTETFTRRLGLRRSRWSTSLTRRHVGTPRHEHDVPRERADLFCKGANWIPCDGLPERQTPERYRDLLASARDANMNMIRLWGGGQSRTTPFTSCATSWD
jgi:beta-mannosidase